jgi:hypothetical protein
VWAYVETTNTIDLFNIVVDTNVDLTLIGVESSVVKTIYIKTTLTDYPNVFSYNQVDVEITAAACDCSLLAWDNPTTSTPTIFVGTGSTETIPPPIVNTGARSTSAAFDNCYLTSADCDEEGAYQAGSITYDDGTNAGTTLPAWITFSSSGVAAQDVAINPVDGSVNGFHTLFATYTPVNGATVFFTAITFEIQCAVASYALPTTPAEPAFDLSYIIYDDPMVINLSTQVYQESPDCLYATTSTYTWTGLDSTFMVIDADNDSIVTVQSSDKTKTAGSPFTVTYQRTMTITASGQTHASGATDFLDDPADLMTFVVTVVDPCVGGTINDPTLTAMTVQNGGTATEDFLDATDTVDDTYVIQSLCGDRDYAVYETDSSGSPLTWITVAKDTTALGTHTITANPDDVALVTGAQHQLKLRITYVDYPSHAGKWVTLPITVNHADCDCELLLWDNPARTDVTINVGVGVAESVNIPVATANTASKSATQEIAKCYIGGACVETSTYALLLDTGDALPLTGNSGFITVNGDSTIISVYPTKPADIGTWLIMMTQDTASGANPAYEAVLLTVGCTITDIASPTAPDEGNGWTLTYNIWETDLLIDLATILYP